MYDPPNSSRFSRPLWFILGVCALILGCLGVVLPVLPTTPFVILAAFAFGKSSPRLRNALLNHRIFGPMIRDWEANGTIALRYKLIAYSFMAAAFLGSVLAGLPPMVLTIQAICLSGAAVYIHTRPLPGPKDTNDEH